MNEKMWKIVDEFDKKDYIRHEKLIDTTEMHRISDQNICVYAKNVVSLHQKLKLIICITLKLIEDEAENRKSFEALVGFLP